MKQKFKSRKRFIRRKREKEYEKKVHESRGDILYSNFQYYCVFKKRKITKI